MKTTEQPDPAAIFGAALSLYDSLQQLDSEPLTDHYGGWDAVMREVMRVATMFEEWACKHVDFEKLNSVWPYDLETNFGPAVLSIFEPDKLDGLKPLGMVLIARHMNLPLR